MSVYFFYRCPYEAPAGSHLQRFDDDTVLDWFRSRWHTLSGTDRDTVHERVGRELGCRVYSFPHLFVQVAEQSLPLPATPQDLLAAMEEVYVNEVRCDSPHLLQVATDDDEVGLAYYFFDDHYLARHGKRAAFLLRDGWKLPGGGGPGGFRAAEKTTRLKPRGPEQGTTYVIDLDHVPDMENLTDGCRIDGVRLPGLAKYLARKTPDPNAPDLLLVPRVLLTVEPPSGEPLEKAFLRDLREHPGDEAAWGAYSDWLQERGELAAGLHTLRRALTWAGRWYDTKRVDQAGEFGAMTADLPTAARWAQKQVRTLERARPASRSLVHVEEHVAQLCLHYHHWKSSDRHIYHEWIFFDDLWASAHPDLANAILRHVGRWDVLSSSRS
jgi:uncharacterized protein (TIGR02996 family)